MNVQFGQGSKETAHFCSTCCPLGWLNWSERIQFPERSLTFVVLGAARWFVSTEAFLEVAGVSSQRSGWVSE